jgi:hypothetical protein
MRRFSNKKKTQEETRPSSFVVLNVRRGPGPTPWTKSSGEASTTARQPTAAPHNPPQMAPITSGSDGPSAVALGKRPVSRDASAARASSSRIRTHPPPPVHTEEQHRYYSELSEDDKDALSKGEKNHNLMEYTPIVSIGKHDARKFLIPQDMDNVGKFEANARIEMDKQRSQKHLEDMAAQTTSHVRSVTEPVPQLPPIQRASSVSYSYAPQQRPVSRPSQGRAPQLHPISHPSQDAPQQRPVSRPHQDHPSQLPPVPLFSQDYAPQLPPLPQLSQDSSQLLHTFDFDFEGASSLSAGDPSPAQHVRAVSSGQVLSPQPIRPIAIPPAQQPSPPSSRASSRVRSPLVASWQPAPSRPSQLPQPPRPATQPTTQQPFTSSPTPTSSRDRIPFADPWRSSSAAAPAVSSRVRSQEPVRHKHNPTTTFDDFLAPHKSNKAWVLQGAPDAKKDKHFAERGRPLSRESEVSSPSSSPAQRIKDQFYTIAGSRERRARGRRPDREGDNTPPPFR